MVSVKDSLALLAGVLLGSGIGLIAGRWLLGLPLQPLVISVLGIGGALLRPRNGRWMSALAMSIVSAATAVGLRSAITALYLLAVGDPAARAIQMIPETLPQTLSAEARLAPLLILSLALAVSQALLMDGLARLASPLWIGLEALRPSITFVREMKVLDLAVGAPLGALAALADARLGLGCALFMALVAARIPLSTASTMFIHGLLALHLSYVLDKVAMSSIEVGVQAGVIAATLAAALLLHASGGAEAYRGIVVSLAAVAGGLLLLLLSSAALIGPQWAVYVALIAVVASLLTLFAVVRVEGALLLPLFSPDPLVPSVAWLAWFRIAEWVGLDTRLVAVVANPVLLTLLALVTVWNLGSSDGRYTVFTAVTAVVFSAALILFRNLAKPEMAPLPDYYAWRLPWGSQPSVNVAIVVSASAVTVLLCMVVHYALPPFSRASYARSLLDPGGLLFVYGFSGSLWRLAKGGYRAGGLAFLVAAGVVATAKAFLGKWKYEERLKAAARGALSAYWPVYAVLLGLFWL